MSRFFPLGFLIVFGCTGASREDVAAGADSSFAALQARGETAMGVDQYTSSHLFESLPDGGRIVLQRDSIDAAGTEVIRAHMRDVASRFSGGDFAIPGMVHAQDVPGTAEMAALRQRITYRAYTLPRGAQVWITSSDPSAVAAIHRFLAFQRLDHRAAGHPM